MLSALRKRVHLSPATAIAFLALVFAITGGAFAATGGNGGGGSSHATFIASAAKSKSKAKVKVGPRGPAGPAGKNGANGANGAAGAQGPQGASGAKGENGTPGTPGEKGTNGADGKSVQTSEFTGTKEPSSKPCKGAGGSEFEVVGSSAPPTYACNGGGGSGGGYPETLPEGKTETGTWSILENLHLVEGEIVAATTAISFPIPLPEPAERAKAAKIEYVQLDESFTEPLPTGNANCPGLNPTPQAAKGYLCIYSIQAFEFGVHEEKYHNPESLLAGFNEHYASRSGVTLVFESEAGHESNEHGNAPKKIEPTQIHAEGAWAVTAE
jgi:hypothetical protein